MSVKIWKTNVTKLIAVSAGHFMNDFYSGLILPILFLFTNALSLSLSQQAFIGFVITGSCSFAQPIIGHIVDKRGKPWILIISVLWISFWMSITGIITNYYLLVFTVGIGGLASALFHPLGSAVAIRLAEKTKGTSLSIFMTIGSFAASVSPIVALPIATKYGLGKLVYLMIPGIITAALMYIAKIHKVEFEQTLDSKKDVKEKFDYQVYKNLSMLIMIATIRMIVKSTLIIFGAQILQEKGVPLTMVGVIITLHLFINTVGILLGGMLSDALGNKKILNLSNLIGMAFVGLFFRTTGMLAVISYIIIGFSLSASNTPVVIMAQEVVPHRMNFAMGLMGFANGIAGLGVVLYGNLADGLGLIPATGLLIIPLAIANVLIYLLPRRALKECESLQL